MLVRYEMRGEFSVKVHGSSSKFYCMKLRKTATNGFKFYARFLKFYDRKTFGLEICSERMRKERPTRGRLTREFHANFNVFGKEK